MAAMHARSFFPTLIAALVLLVGVSVASAAPDPAECPFELGYNPTFNADGSILICVKGQESFQVDPGLILARSLRGIGRSFQAVVSGIIDGDLSVFGKFIEPNALLALPNGGPVPVTDPAVANFVATYLVFAPGVDRTSAFDISNYHFLDNNDPRVASVHIRIFSAVATVDVDTVWRFNLVNGQRVWQLHTDSNIVVTPK